MPKNNSPKRREGRKAEAAARLKKNKVIDCQRTDCCKRHAVGWSGCKAVAE